MRSPASPYAFENVLAMIRLGYFFSKETESGKRVSHTYSQYASSTTIKTGEGNRFINSFSSSWVIMVPVGLFGLARKITLVFLFSKGKIFLSRHIKFSC